MSLFYITLLVLTTLIWGYVFYKKDYHPQPLKVIGQSFLMGLFAMIPVFAYKYVYQNYLPMLAEYQIFRPLLNSSILSGFGVFIFNLVILSLILFAFSSIISILLNFFNHSVLTNIKNAIKDEPLGFTFVSVLIGISIFLQTALQKFLSIPIIGTVLGTILFLAIIEEYIKHLMVRITDDKKLKDIDDAITLSIVVGLAFAFLETIIYSLAVGDIGIIFYRAMISIPIHIVASGIFGYYYGLAHFAKPIVQLEGGDKTYRKKWLPKILSLKKSTLYHEEKMVEGIFFATLFHAAMNLLFELSLGFLAVPFIVLGVVMIFKMYNFGQAEDRLIARLRQKGLKRKSVLARN
jgi:RsiW-degrading membrane proteinase PrsW (M82 family)